MQEQKVAVVFGAGGIGRAIIFQFVRRHYLVAVADIEKAQPPGVSMSAVCDISNELDVRTFIRSVADVFGNINDVAVTSGITDDGFLVKCPKKFVHCSQGEPCDECERKDMETDKFDRVVRCHLYGGFYVARATLPYLIRTKGSLTFTSSIVGQDGNIGQVNYAAAKSGIEGMTRSLGKEYAKYGVRINCVAPGFTRTRMIDTIPEKLKKALNEKGYILEPHVVAAEYLRLAEGLATGQVVRVDGGCTL